MTNTEKESNRSEIQASASEDKDHKKNSQVIDDNDDEALRIRGRLLKRTIFDAVLVLLAVLLLAPRGLSFAFYATCVIAGMYTIYGIWLGMRWARITLIIFSVFMILSIGPFFIFIALGLWNLMFIIIKWWELDRALPNDTRFSLFLN